MDYTNGQQSATESTSRNVRSKGNQARRMAEQAGDTVNEAMSSVSGAISDRTQKLSEQFSDVSQRVQGRVGDMRMRTSETVARNPFYSIGIAACAGLVLGLLLRRGH